MFSKTEISTARERIDTVLGEGVTWAELLNWGCSAEVVLLGAPALHWGALMRCYCNHINTEVMDAWGYVDGQVHNSQRSQDSTAPQWTGIPQADGRPSFSSFMCRVRLEVCSVCTFFSASGQQSMPWAEQKDRESCRDVPPEYCTILQQFAVRGLWELSRHFWM